MDVISVDGLSVAYKMYAKPTDILREAIFGGQRHDKFWALRDVSLRIRDGERVGIVGPNGAGKSTLLKVIAGNLTPTSGKISVNGKISSLLSMTPAWNEEANGIENIRFNLLLQGMPDNQIARAVEDIIDFTELGQFIYQPVKTYSTGMGARLSFAIATATEPDILIIDEVLGTGDGYFAAKAYQRMQEFCERGRALLFVSHSVAAVQQMCSTAIWMQHGTVREIGDVATVLPRYEADYRKSEDEATRAEQIRKSNLNPSTPVAAELDSEDFRLRIVPQSGGRFFSSHFVRSIEIVNPLVPEALRVPLGFSGDAAARNSSLDLLSSEWGRLHERMGVECRLLQKATGRSPGGQIVLGGEYSKCSDDGRVELRVVLETASQDSTEQLALEALDLKQGGWSRADCIETKRLNDGWVRSLFSVSVDLPEKEVRAQIRQRLIELGRSDVEITGVEIRADGKTTTSIQQFQPFQFVIDVEFRNRVHLADIAIRVTRSDGIHVFWQSSGVVDANLADPLGKYRVTFDVSENLFGSGEYYVNIVVANGWNYPHNFPYSEVYCRALNAAFFRVHRKLSEVDFGVIAKHFPVSISPLSEYPVSEL